MANSYKFSIISAAPNPQRGEKVNIGIAVFGDRGVESHIFSTRKISTLASGQWGEIVNDYVKALKGMKIENGDIDAVYNFVKNLNDQIILSEIGWFEARDNKEYQKMIDRLAADLMLPPKAIYAKKPKGVSAEIAGQFRKAKILAETGQGLDTGRVVKDYIVDASEGLSADFAIKNGKLTVATALDLRSVQPRLGQAALKAITLDKVHRSNTNAACFGVYAVVPSRQNEVKEHVSLLREYSDETFNWMVPDDRERFLRVFYDAFNTHGQPPIA